MWRPTSPQAATPPVSEVFVMSATLVKDNVAIGECRWSIYNTMGVEDWEIVYVYTDGDYQGSCDYIAWNNPSWMGPEFVMVSWSWGSCSGCDGYEDLSEGERFKAFANQREYYDEAAMKAWLSNFESTNREVLKRSYAGVETYNDWLNKVNAIRHQLDMPAWVP